jgi:hypothetical protein
MPSWGAAQLIFGLLMPLLLVSHVMGTRVNQLITGFEVDYLCVMFVGNRFFEEMSAALHDTSGHCAQFAGDGLIALSGLRGSIGKACRDSLRGA